MSLIPLIRSSALERYTLLTTSISFNGEIISPYSYYIKKGLIYIIMISLFSCQPFSYSKYTKANTCLLCDMRSVLFNKYRFFYRVRYYAY